VRLVSDGPRPVLLLAYKYPPYPGVGAFRWAKLSKYLARLGHPVHVLTVSWAHTGPDTVPVPREAGLEIQEIPSGGPHRLRHRRISNRLAATARGIAMARLDNRRYWDDEAQRWERHVVPTALELADSRGIDTLIATGHPFQANRWAAAIRRRRPGLKLIQDFRDPWAANPFRSLPPDRRARVEEWQREAVEAADAVVSVTPRLLELYLAKAPGKRGLVVNNGVDPEDVSAIERSVPDTGPIRLTHIGNVSNGRDRPLAALLDAIRALPDGAPEFEVTLIGGQVEAVARRHADLIRSGVLVTHPAMAQREAFQRVAAGHYALQLNAREFPYGLSTKVYEYALLRVPVVSLNYGGDIHELITGHGFGHSLDLGGDADLPGFLRSLPRQPAEPPRFDAGPFTYPVLARAYSELIADL
jgi:glycosyltransferase involved in cell wall biosynthesis